MATTENPALPNHQSGVEKEKESRTENRRCGMRRLAKLDDFIQNLQSVKDLHDNVASGKLYLIHRMLINGKMDVNSVNDEGDTALTVALHCGQKEAFRLLLKHGADPNIRSPPKERSLYIGQSESESESESLWSMCFPETAVAACPDCFIWCGLCENSPLWKTIKFRDVEWCEMVMEAGYSTEKDEEKEGWMEALRGYLASIEKKKKEEGIDLTQDPFSLTYANFFQWYDGTLHNPLHNPPSLAQSCRQSIRQRMLELTDGCSIYSAIEAGLKEQVPRRVRNFLLFQDGNEKEIWLEDYKENKAKAFEKLFVFVDDNVEADKHGAVEIGIGLNVSHG